MKKAIQTAIARAIMQALDRWSRDTGHLSADHQIRRHPSFEVIVAIGDQAIPTLIREMAEFPWLCMMCLWEIVGKERGPNIREEDRGRAGSLIAAWRQWFKNNERK